MAVQWNDNQKKAIEGRNGTMLVSAAAGSGKTAVLVERVIRRLCDETNPCSIEDLLIVTFTRAAAAQMKEKITVALQSKIAEQPGNKALHKNLFMLPYANISTIDSFCINLVRDNYHKLGISPDFRILDENRRAVISDRAMTQVMDRLHKERADDFRGLNRLINSSTSDVKITETIRNIYEKSRGCIFPHSFIEGISRDYEDIKPVSESPWGKLALEGASEYLADILKAIDKGIALTSPLPAFEKFLDALSDEKIYFEKLKDAVDRADWGGAHRIMSGAEFASPRKNSRCDEVLVNQIHAIRGYARKTDKNYFKKHMSEFYISPEAHLEMMEAQANAVITLRDAVLCYEQALSEIKEEANSYSFDDILHFTLELLVTDENGTPVRTAFAKELSENYDEILVDEYQDVSRAQDAVFRALSKDDTNRFMVGDVKQSIYSFRLATPEVFTDLRKQMADYDGVHYPARVDLSANYRSRKGITDTVNFIFSQIMSEKAGGVLYDSREQLNPEAKFPESDGVCAEAYLLTGSDKQSSAVFTANYIANAVKNEMQITENGVMRNAKYSDFCILARDSKSCNIYAEVFRNARIPLIIGTSNSLLQTPEIMFIVSLLRVIDNPVNDVPLTAVLLSPTFGFTADELSEMRIASRSGNIYSCLSASAGRGNEKAAYFLSTLERLRRLAVNLPAGEFTNRLVEETGYRAIVCAMSNYEIRLTNINLFINMAEDYESSGIKGISAFLRFIDSIEENESATVSCSSHTDASDAVTMTTIHKSKGLEYPVVILCETEKPFNEMDSKDNVLVHEELGVGIKYVDDSVSYETLPHLCIKNEIKRKQRSEELRVLYVALTRPKEKLVIIAQKPDWEKALRDWSVNVTEGVNPGARRVLNMANYAQILMTALMKHPDANLLRVAAELGAEVRENCAGRMNFEFVENVSAEEGEDDDYAVSHKADSVLLKAIGERLSYSYPYSALDGIKAKRIASDFEDEGFDLTYFASDRPAFMSSTGLTPAQRGTATHRFMQYADYRRAAKSVENELERLESESILTPEEAQAVDVASVQKFFISSVADRILALPEEDVFKEFAFTVSMPLSEVYPDIDPGVAAGEVIVIEGVADCAFIENGKLVIVDYKTDRAQSLSELAVRYAPQLTTYRKCLSKVFNMEVSETLIYSFRFGAEIKIK